MTPVEAARILELPENATPEQIEARYNELRAKLEDKIAKAPTPGLKTKYRESLDEITTAFETLTLAADSSALPVLKKDTGDRRLDTGRSGSAGAAATPPRGGESENRKSRIEKQKSGKEFLIVAVIAVAVLAAGGWWVMKTRAEKAEQARIAAEAKAEADRVAAAAKVEADRKAEEARLAAEAQRRAEEEERIRVVAAEKAEQQRLEKVHAQVSAELVNLRIGWEAADTEARKSERRLSELRGEERNLARGGINPDLLRLRAEVAAQASFQEWLDSQLGRHEAKVLRGQAEAMIAARQYDEAARLVAQAGAAQAALDREIAAKRVELLAISGPLTLDLKPAAAEWTLTDAHGAQHTGRGAAQLDDLPFGPVVVEVSLAGYQPKRLEGANRREQPGRIAWEFKPAVVRVDSTPAAAEVTLGGKPFGVTPAVIEWPGDGEQTLTVKWHGRRPVEKKISLVSGAVLDLGTLDLEAYPQAVIRSDFALGPKRFIVTQKHTSNIRTSTNLGAGTSLKVDQHYEHQMEIESPTDSAADATRVVRTTIRHEVDGKAILFPGTIQDVRKVRDGWQTTYVKGGFVDPAMRKYQQPSVNKGSPASRRVHVDTPEWWPTENKYPGDTWSVPLTVLSGAGLFSAWETERKGTVTGKVLALRREDGRDVADVEFTVDVSSTFITDSARQPASVTGKLTCTLDLSRNFVSAENYTFEENSRMELSSAPDYRSETKTTIVGSASVRPL